MRDKAACSKRDRHNAGTASLDRARDMQDFAGLKAAATSKPPRARRAVPLRCGVSRGGGAEEFLDAGDVFGDIHADRIVRRLSNADPVAVLEPAQLLQLFDFFQFALREGNLFGRRGTTLTRNVGGLLDISLITS